MRTALITLGSAFLTSATIANAFLQKRQFFPSVVYITKSNPSMAVLYIQAFVFVMLLGKILRKIFFGQLRAAEMEHLMERSWYAVTETCLAFTVFRDDFSPKFVALFTLLLFLKAFHWLTEDRIDYIERSPVITVKFHIRAICLLLFLGMVDGVLIHHAFRTTMQHGASVQLVFGFEYGILLTMIVTTMMKYVLHSIDLQREVPWENKSVYLLYTELITGFFKTVLYVVFVFIMIKIHTFPLFAIRPMYLTLRAFKKSVSDVVLSRRAIAYMNTFYLDASEEELTQLDNVCIICRDEMTSGKKLPCNHIFHAHCLRSWFQRQQSCPTCRLDVLRPIEQQQQRRRQAQAHAQAQAPPQAPPPQNAPGFVGMPPNPPFAFWNAAMQPPPVGVPGAAAASATPTASATAAGSIPSTLPSAMPGQMPGMYSMPGMPPMPGMPSMPGMPPMPGMDFPPFVPPPFMPLPMFGMPAFPPQLFPNAPQNLSELSVEELQQMEGQERANVEARIKVLRNVHSLLDSAVIQLNQYSHVITTLNLLSTLSTPTPAEEAVSTKPQETQQQQPKQQKDELQQQHTEDSNMEPGPSEVVDSDTIVGAEETMDNDNELRRRRLEKFAKPVETLPSNETLSRTDS